MISNLYDQKSSLLASLSIGEKKEESKIDIKYILKLLLLIVFYLLPLFRLTQVLESHVVLTYFVECRKPISNVNVDC